MRVIAGKYRSRPLRSLRGMEIRPTADHLRETLFDVLAAARDLEGAVWLDLYAGTGAVGIEALSRGAHSVYFVETSRPAAALIRQNLASLGVEDGFEIVEQDVPRALRRLDAAALTCDICFLDPPYTLAEAYEQTLGFLSQSRLLRPAGVVVAEHDKKFDPGALVGSLCRYRTLVQGGAALSFYRLQ
jgi:16S rRNA (guanine(966)-N(2))-methyltransferase RsmD